MGSLNYRELKKIVAEGAGLTQEKAMEVIRAFTGGLENAMKKGEEMMIVGFGKFKGINRKAKNGFNPHTGKPMKIAAKRVPVFKASKKFFD